MMDCEREGWNRRGRVEFSFVALHAGNILRKCKDWVYSKARKINFYVLAQKDSPPRQDNERSTFNIQ